jgi:hypothetical protein
MTRLKLLPSALGDSGDTTNKAPTRGEVEQEVRAEVEALLAQATKEPDGDETFLLFEKALIPRVFLLGRLLLVLFLCVREERERARTSSRMQKDGRVYQRRPAQARNLNTFFGVVRYFRTYLRGPEGQGYHPLDVELGLTTDRVSMHLLSLAARLATKLSFAQVHATLSWFLGAVPSTEVIEQTVLGLGRRTAEWFEHAPAPMEDGEVLIIQVDGKGVPTATETELQRRRGPRREKRFPHSARHRGRAHRERYGKKPRRNKGDKSKNARMATVVVMYTLHRDPHGTGWLLGPLNRRVYASFAPKRHAFAIARREADKRGFTKDSGKLVQIVTDGDDDLALYAKEFFPEALHTVDLMHVVEYVYGAAACLYREGSAELGVWVDEQKDRLYKAQEAEVVAEIRRRALRLCGPGTREKRERLERAARYLEKRLGQMNYKFLLEQDLELASGAVEGAVKNLVGARFDFGGSRWIRERAEPLLQLRCIEANGDWDTFIQWVHDDHRRRGRESGARIRIQQKAPSPLPTLAVAA